MCPTEGHFAFENNECSSSFIKCSRSFESNKLEGSLNSCPTGYAYWARSRRCERMAKLPNCVSKSEKRYGIPVEWINIGKRRSLRFDF